MEQSDFKTARHDNITQEQADSMTIEQQRILKLEQRVEEAEAQLLVCLKYIRNEAEKRRETQEQQLLERGPAAEA